MYKLVIEEDYKSGTSKYRNLQKITYWCYYYIHSIHGQFQVELSAALTHLKAYRLSGEVGWQLTNQVPNVPLQPMIPLVICGETESESWTLRKGKMSGFQKQWGKDNKDKIKPQFHLKYQIPKIWTN